MDSFPVVVAPHQSHITTELYAAKLHLTTGRLDPMRSPTRNKAMHAPPSFDFRVTNTGGQRFLIAWIRESHLADIEKVCSRVDACIRATSVDVRRKETLIVLCTRSETCLDAYSAVQSYVVNQGIRCVPVGPSVAALATILKHFQLQSRTRRFTRPLNKDLQETMIKNCTIVPSIGEKTAREKLLPTCERLRSLATASANNDPALLRAVGQASASALQALFTTPLPPS
mmetsp:Transcript_13373/g.24759  ORF Transcript_13373/g.24759 Transcript_13373/m.24759 type:complete len:228 (+) Transcript_13373:301-984(+)